MQINNKHKKQELKTLVYILSQAPLFIPYLFYCNSTRVGVKLRESESNEKGGMMGEGVYARIPK